MDRLVVVAVVEPVRPAAGAAAVVVRHVRALAVVEAVAEAVAVRRTLVVVAAVERITRKQAR
jgi:hypothetical protein